MNVLILQFVNPLQPRPQPVFSHNLGVLAAMLKNEGIEASLIALGGYKSDLLREAIVQHRPRAVLAELPLHSVSAVRRTIVDIGNSFGLPVAVCGLYATCRPNDAISIPSVEALLLGEYDHSGVALMKAWRDRADPAGLPGTWIPTRKGIVKGPLPHLVEDLDSLPAPDRGLFDYARIVEATKEASFKVARGCPLWCAQCCNDWYMDLYEDKGTFVRRRSVSGVLDEIAEVLETFSGAQSVAFYDHCFAMDLDWLSRFADGYAGRFTLPFRCHVHLNHMTAETVELLKRARCRWVHTHVGAGSRFVREEILTMQLGGKTMMQAAKLLRSAGIRLVAEVFVGAPYESEITIEETLEMLRKLEAHEVHPRSFYPLPGTRAAELCAENGWIRSRGDEDYWAGRGVLDMPSMSPENVDAVVQKFSSLMKKRSRSALRKSLGKIRVAQKKNALGLSKRRNGR